MLVSPAISVSPELSHKICFVDWPLPSREELRGLVQTVIDEVTRDGNKVRLNLSPEEGSSLLSALAGLTWKQAREALVYSLVVDGSLNRMDIDRILDRKARSLRDGIALDYFPPHSLSSELGGFDALKVFCERARASFSAEAKKLNLPSAKGVLLVGVPGCGKSMAAKAIAAAWSLPLLKLDAGRLFDKYIGESERNFRRAIRAAEAMSPCVFWIDEIEKAMPAGEGGGGADSGLSKRLFGAFLTWLQEKKASVFVVATANDLSSLPPELLRKGRFDEIFFVDLPTQSERAEILRMHLARRKEQVGEVDVDTIVRLTDEFSGAELEQVVVSAALSALQRKTLVNTQDLATETKRMIPLARSRPDEISRLREIASRQFVSVRGTKA
ncbi:MAG: AAA family ATPase [Calothrix sp. SM1_5_4]|nr:AAA family ATPase [Calothrix sp. SM1_5_4]